MKLHSPAARRVAGLLVLGVLCLALDADSAGAKPARCSTTDEGSYRCDFRLTSKDGSFTISAPGKPTYILNVDEPGVAYGFVNLGTGNKALPGRYLRDKAEPACWVNDATQAKICAY